MTKIKDDGEVFFISAPFGSHRLPPSYYYLYTII
ncbi:uncharacterized protein METZ01_LOCUS509725 [marine metagenome]|uniref:Uncharacterized protein n=1 Tax=marine metagenome TaxID=408172 RepID=A0A383EJE8_9ZZZZ